MMGGHSMRFTLFFIYSQGMYNAAAWHKFFFNATEALAVASLLAQALDACNYYLSQKTERFSHGEVENALENRFSFSHCS
jgi:hypothetical protein